MARIVKILRVVDTREREEVADGRFVAIPGSGRPRPCDRCGREHEIHVDAELEDGRTIVIGQGCARGESAEVVSRIKSAISAAKTRSRLAAELGAAEQAIAIAQFAWTASLRLTLPPVEFVRSEATRHGDRQVWRAGDAEVWTLPGHSFDGERRAALESAWRFARYHELAGTRVTPGAMAGEVADLRRRLARADARLATLLSD